MLSKFSTKDTHAHTKQVSATETSIFILISQKFSYNLLLPFANQYPKQRHCQGWLLFWTCNLLKNQIFMWTLAFLPTQSPRRVTKTSSVKVSKSTKGDMIRCKCIITAQENYKLVCYLLLFPIQIIWYPVLTKVLSRIFMTANTAPYNLYRIKLFWKAHNLDCFWSLWTVSLPKIVWSGNLPLSNCQTSCCVIKDNKYRYIALDLSLFCLLGVFLYHVEKHQEKQGKDKSSMPTP